MAELFVISPEFEKKLHPEAREIFHDWVAEIQHQVQLDEVTDDDLNSLSDDEKIKLKTSVLKIPECLKKCIDIKEGDKLYDVYFGDIFLQSGVISELKRDLMFIKWDIEPPLRKIHLAKLAKTKEELRKRVQEEKDKLEEAREIERKREEEERQRAAKAKEEQRKREEEAEAQRRKKEEEERWRAACKAVNPPIDDAKMYLNKPGEHDKYVKAALVAIEVYMEKGQDYLNDSRTFDYRWCLKKISDGKEEERQKIAANFAAQEYNRRLNDEKARLKALLCPNRKDHESYFKKQIKDHRYTGENFTQFLSSEEEQDFDKTIVYIGRKKLDGIVSSDFRQFIDGNVGDPILSCLLLSIAWRAYRASISCLMSSPL